MGLFNLFRVVTTGTPYELGLSAGWRDGEYRDLKEASKNPFAPGTAKHEAWARGFGQGILEAETVIENAMKNIL